VEVTGQAIFMRKNISVSEFKKKTQFLALIGAVVEV
jgi:hypothetical protein